MRHAVRVAEIAGRAHALGRAARALRARRGGVDPEAQGQTDGGAALADGVREDDRGVHAAAHRDADAVGIRGGARAAQDGVAERGVERVDGGDRAGRVLDVAAAEARGLEQRAPLGLRGQRRDRGGGGGAGVGAEAHGGDAVAVEAQGHAHAVVAAAAARAAVAVGRLDRAGAGQVDHADALAASRPISISAQAATSASTSAAVVVGPSDTRTAPRASAASMPIAPSTGSGVGSPLAHADPAETAMPRSSSRRTTVSPR